MTYGCKICKLEFDNRHKKAAHVSHVHTIRKSQKLLRLKVKKVCPKCGNDFYVKRIVKKDGTIGRTHEFEKRHCSRSCANSKMRRKETNLKISRKLSGRKFPDRMIKRVKRICLSCGKEFIVKYNSKQKYCGNICGGREAYKQRRDVKRSRNEIAFAELCKEKFKNVLCNHRLFNGWDADVILTDYKYAILWNGVWHYRKLFEKHSLKQVQNRDRIKLNEIRKYGYIPYIIRDEHTNSKKFVKQEFEKLRKVLIMGV